MGIPDLLLQQDQFVGWMTCIHTLMDMPVPKARLVLQLHAVICLLTEYLVDPASGAKLMLAPVMRNHM